MFKYLLKLEINHKRAKNTPKKHFIYSNNIYKIGDILANSWKVYDIGYTSYSNLSN